MSSDIRLTPTSYIVLGLLDAAGEATPYDMKRIVAVGLGDFWTLQHAQLYSEPERLAAAGYLSERREKSGRRRKHYKVTAQGRRALRDWLSEPTGELAELRDPALLKLFFGANPKLLAKTQMPAHRGKLAEYEGLRDQLGADAPTGMRLSLDVGIRHEQEWVRFWSRLSKTGEA
jgi:PadR family transcriptional regulator, regulatory protein AphA